MTESQRQALELVNSEIGKAAGQGALAEFVKVQNFAVKLAEIAILLHDPDPCEYDHHGYCQAHSLHENPCPHGVMQHLLQGMPNLPNAV